MPQVLKQAPKLSISSWLNSKQAISLENYYGKIVIIYAFQMLCPGCIQHSLPQASRVQQMFSEKNVQVLGLHSVFEHHQVMNEAALSVFCQEFRITFPVAIDQATNSGLPKTMQDYQMQGTPTFIAIDKHGKLRLQHFGHISDLEVGSIIGSLLAEQIATPT